MAQQSQLSLYVTTKATCTEDEILAHASQYLPNYMIPSAVIILSEFPTTANGKVDRNRLPLPTTLRQLVSPSNSQQRTIHEVFCDVLDVTVCKP